MFPRHLLRIEGASGGLFSRMLTLTTERSRPRVNNNERTEIRKKEKMATLELPTMKTTRWICNELSATACFNLCHGPCVWH
jgi:hypothetical protein